jgi:hypothetical protein
VVERHGTNPVRRHLVVAAGLVVIAGLTTACGGDPGPSGLAPPPHSLSGAPHSSSVEEPTQSDSTQPVAVAEPAPRVLSPQVADPRLVSVPALNISAELKPLHLDAKGRLAPPRYGVAGWYEAGPEPGEPGRAVIAGHVDTEVGPDVFYGLGDAQRGQRIRVGLEDGTTLTFQVTAVEQFSRGAFPTQRVYGKTDKRELRLITCGGDFDRAVGHYQDNLVVFAKLAT